MKNGIPELKVVNVLKKTVFQLEGKWSYGMSDNLNPEYIYLIEQQSNRLYKANSLASLTNKNNDQNALFSTQIILPPSFYHVKVDSNKIYSGNGENIGDYLNVLPINSNAKGDKYLLNDFNGYDVNNGTIIAKRH